MYAVVYLESTPQPLKTIISTCSDHVRIETQTDSKFMKEASTLYSNWNYLLCRILHSNLNFQSKLCWRPDQRVSSLRLSVLASLCSIANWSVRFSHGRRV